MVFFTCSGCGEAVKKAQVEKHRWQCRRSGALTCVDCHKDFHGDEYQDHIKCVSEDQKYGGQNYVAKANKGEAKQDKWYQQVQRAIDSTNVRDSNLRALLERVRNYSNIPRKQQKFVSFLKNSLRVHNQQLIAEAWNAIAAAVEQKPADANENGAETKPNETADEAGQKRKRPDDDSNETVENGSDVKRLRSASSVEGVEANGAKQKFKWRKVIKCHLKTAQGNEMKMKKLRKRVVEEYKTNTTPEKRLQDEELTNYFDKAFQRLITRKSLKLEDNIARLIC